MFDLVQQVVYEVTGKTGLTMERFSKLGEVFGIDPKRPIRKLSKGMQKQAAFWLTVSMNYAEITDALPYAVDLDGDSANETVEFVKKQAPDGSDMQYAVRVTDGGMTAEYQTQIISDPSLWCADVDYDGVMVARSVYR